jgi:guanine deaminase
MHSKTGEGESHQRFIDQAVRLAADAARSGRSGPFGALVVRDGEIIGQGCNAVTGALDPTAHAEVLAIRSACREVGDFRLDGALLYASCMPCPMCYAAIYWARIERVYYAAAGELAAAAGFDDLLIAAALRQAPEFRTVPCQRLPVADAEKPFRIWRELPERVEY